MRSTSSTPPAVSLDDRTARARIRDAALERFAADGVARTTIRSVAADADVSPALVIHHFGSKGRLRQACDEHVVAVIGERKREAAAAGPGVDPIAALREAEEGPSILRYLARTLVDGSPHVGALVDDMVEDAVAYMAEGERTGLLKPSDQPRERAVVLVIWQLGALVLHDHVARLLGADLTAGTEGMVRWAVPAAEVLSRGVMADELYDRVREAFADHLEEST